MGDPRRFELLADWIEAHAPSKAIRIADVASGSGALAFALRRRGFRNVVPFEPSPRRGGHVTRLGMQVRQFRPEDARGFDLLAGMHPDGATDCILAGAAHEGIAAVVSPCCVRPSAWVYWGNKLSRKDWQAHLVAKSLEKGLRLEVGRLRMTGANSLLFGGDFLGARA